MRRFVSIMMAFVLLCISIPSYAEEATSITFRGIPWGSSPDEAISMLKEDLGLDEIDVTYIMHEVDTFQPYIFKHRGSDSSYDIPMLECRIAIPDLIVAGYNAYGEKRYTGFDKNNIILYFMPILSEDRTTYSISEHDGALWRAVYPYLSRQNDTVAALEDKLCELYGNGHTRYAKSLPGADANITELWETENGIVETQDHTGYSWKYKLEYRCTISDTKMDDAYTIRCIYTAAKEKAEQDKKDADKSGTDGL